MTKLPIPGGPKGVDAAVTGAGTTLLLALAFLAGLGVAPPGTTARGRVLELHPSTAASCDEEFAKMANSLEPGDRLVLRGGTYSQDCRRRISGRHGAPEHPIVITSGPGETAVLTRPKRPGHRYTENNLEIDDSTYLVLRGLELRGGSTGIRFVGTNRHIVLEDNEIHDLANNAIAMNSGDTEGFIIRRNHIHHTGLLARSAGTTEGEGLYIGCHDGDCIASNHLIEGNYIHHLRGTSAGGNDGIEIKLGSYGIVVRNNVIHNTDIGTHYPCIFVYGGGAARNIVEQNAMWSCGEAIQVVSDATIRNNIVAASDVGITSAPHERVKEMKNVTIVNNTIYGHRECLHLRWHGARDMVLVNNAVYCPEAKALDATGLDGPSTVVRSNFMQGSLEGGVIDGVWFLAGGRAESAFRGPATLNFWPQVASPLIGLAAARFVPEMDFNGSRRMRPYDVGAYQTGGRSTNPGWRVGPGFKVERTTFGAAAS